MAITIGNVHGRTNEIDQDAITGLHTGDPNNTLSTPGGLALNGDVVFGVPFILKTRLLSAAELKAVVTYTGTIFDANAPFKFEVVGVRWRVVGITTTDWDQADGGNLDITVQDGDTTTNWTDILADQTMDESYSAGMGIEYPHATVAIANTTIGVGEGLRASLVCDPDDTIVAGAGAGPCTVDVFIECIRIH